MSSVEILGRDVALEAYRVRTPEGLAHVPECLMGGLRPGERPSHQEAYEWIAQHRTALTKAVRVLAEGGKPRAPLDIVTLIPAKAP